MASFHSTSHLLRLVALVVVAAAILVTCAQGDQIVVTDNSDIQSLLDSISDDSAGNANNQPAPALKLNLPDASATVGRIFTYPLGLKLQPMKYKIRELGKSGLPDWLTYDEATDELQGVPRPTDVGVSNIAVIPDNPSANGVKHFFTITIGDDRRQNQNPGARDFTANGTALRARLCRTDDPVTMVTVVLDADHEGMNGVDKAKVLSRMAEFLKLMKERLRLLPLENGQAYDNSALVAGPGNQLRQTHSGIQLLWQIGCGSVDSESMQLLEKVEYTARNGKLATAIGHPVVGWHVTNNKPRMVVVRKRRQAPIATATYQPTPPTSRGETDLARSVPSMSSPSFSKHPPRRTKTSGRHAGKATKYRYASPVATLMMTPVVPTPSFSSQPTRTEELIRPTQVLPSSSETETSPEIPVARTDILVQPSHTVTDDSPRFTSTPTEALPTDRYTVVEPSKPTATLAPTDTEIDIVATKIEPPVNENPYVYREMKRIDAKFGEVLNHKIPAKTFLDKEDGNTRALRLMLTLNEYSVTRMHWLQLDTTNQVLKGIRLDEENEGKREYTYTLVAVDNGNRIARTEVQVVLKTPSYQKKNRINHEFTVQLDADYDGFKAMSSNTIDVIENLGRVFGVADPYKEINVLRIESGSVMFTFTMRKIRYNPCPSNELSRFASKLITRNGTINRTLVDQLKPKWRVKSVMFKPMGTCSEADMKPLRAYDTVTPHYPPYNEVDGSKAGASGSALITYILPSAILGFVFLVAIIVACCLHRKRKAKRMEREKNHFSNKGGIPVIFADELEEKPDPPSKPLIMPEEKPPMAQPYLPSRDSPGLDRQRMTYTDFDRDGPPPYRPPPPFASNGHDTRNKPRSNNHQHPQTYILP